MPSDPSRCPDSWLWATRPSSTSIRSEPPIHCRIGTPRVVARATKSSRTGASPGSPAREHRKPMGLPQMRGGLGVAAGRPGLQCRARGARRTSVGVAAGLEAEVGEQDGSARRAGSGRSIFGSGSARSCPVIARNSARFFSLSCSPSSQDTVRVKGSSGRSGAGRALKSVVEERLRERGIVETQDVDSRKPLMIQSSR